MERCAKTQKELEHLTFELESCLGSICTGISTLSDVEIILGQLVVKMDEVMHKGFEKAYYQEHARIIRLLSSLMYFSVEKLNLDFKNAQHIHLALSKGQICPSA